MCGSDRVDRLRGAETEGQVGFTERDSGNVVRPRDDVREGESKTKKSQLRIVVAKTKNCYCLNEKKQISFLFSVHFERLLRTGSGGTSPV